LPRLEVPDVVPIDEDEGRWSINDPPLLFHAELLSIERAKPCCIMLLFPALFQRHLSGGHAIFGEEAPPVRHTSDARDGLCADPAPAHAEATAAAGPISS